MAIDRTMYFRGQTRALSAEAEVSGLRKTAKDLAEADRTRRTRLAELEGKLLRLEHERKPALDPRLAVVNAHTAALAATGAKLDRLKEQIAELAARVRRGRP